MPAAPPRACRAASSPRHLDRLLGVERLRLFVDVERQREDQRDDRHADDDVRQRQGLHDGIDYARPGRNAVEDRGAAAVLVADCEQQHVRRRLHHGQAHGQMNEVPARDDAVKPDQEEPAGDDVREIAHRRRLATGTEYSSRNSLKSSSIAVVTASAVAQLTKGMLPPDSSVPCLPAPRKLWRYAPCAMRPARPSATKAPAPLASAISTAVSGVTPV